MAEVSPHPFLLALSYISHTRYIFIQELGLAVTANNIRNMLYVVSKGANVNHLCDVENCLVPLHVAAQCGHTLACVFLVLNGAKVDPIDAQGWTPLYHAVMNGQAEAAHTLLCFGARMFRDEMTSDDVAVRREVLKRKQKILEGFFGQG